MRKRLPQFEPHDLRSLVHGAGSTNTNSDPDAAFIKAFCKRNNEQIDKLLRALKVDQAKPDVWERAFFHLAFIHHGVGHLAWRPRNPKKNAVTWSLEHEMTLLQEMLALKAKGLSERAAVRKLATDTRKQKLLPYRPQGSPSVAGEKERREAALWRHWQKVKGREPLSSALLRVLLPRSEPRGRMEALLDHLDLMVKI